MGRRSISSTKTGKFMNPTDQARKEARRKELKKNKKQRQLVRQAVLKSKDPTHVLTEIEALDRMEFDPNNPPPYNVKVIQDKRKKLKETWQKLYRFYEREDTKFVSELKFLEREYEKKKSQIMSIYESVKQAEKVSLDDIPLPDAPSNLAALALYQANEIPLPVQSVNSSAQKGILKKTDTSGKRKPPGPPPGPPPPLTEFECDDDVKELGITADDNISNVLNKAKKIRFADDTVKTTVPVPPATIKPQQQYTLPPPPPSYPTPAIRQNIPAAQTNYPLSKHINAYGSVIPPASVPRMSLSSQTTSTSFSSSAQKYPSSTQNVLMAGPTRTTSATIGSLSDDRGPSTTTIEAKPILRNKMAEITRFVPTSLLIKNDPKRKTQKSDNTYPPYMQQQYSQPSSTQQHQPQKSTDEAYEQFMKEMEKIL